MSFNYPGWELKYFDRAKNFRKYQFDLIKKYIKGKTAEIGPGNGINLDHYYQKASLVDCYEPSKNYHQKLKKKFKGKKNVKIYNKFFIKNKKKYDTILYLDVLEHIKSDKKEFLNGFRCLKKNGFLIINVPAFNFLYSEFDKDINHYKRYEIKDFLNFLENVNYKEKKLFYYDSLGFLLSLTAKLLTKKNYKNNFDIKIKFWDALIPMSRLLDKLTFHLFGKSLICIIKKN